MHDRIGRPFRGICADPLSVSRFVSPMAAAASVQPCLRHGHGACSMLLSARGVGGPPLRQRMMPSQHPGEGTPPHTRRAPRRAAAALAAVRPEAAVPNMSAFLDSLKWDNSGLVVAIAQHVDTGEVLMQAFSDRAAVSETLQTG